MNKSNPFLQLDDNVVGIIISFVGPGHYRYIVANKQLQRCYLEVFSGKKEVYAKNAVASISCAEIASVEARQWWINGHPPGAWDSTGKWFTYVRDPKAAICPIAARHNRVDILQWCRMQNYPWHETQQGCPLLRRKTQNHWFETSFPERWQSKIWWDQTCEAAARSGHLDVLVWARDHGCPWDERTCAAAALGGHMEVLTWARDNGCPWDGLTCRAAAFGGHLEILQYAVLHECPWDWRTCEMASKYGRFELLRWATRHGCPWRKHSACLHAAAHGNLEMMEYALANNCPFQMVAYLYAVRGGHVNILEWGLQREDNIFERERFPGYCMAAAARGHLSILQFAREHGQDASDRFYAVTCNAAARHGHLNILTWVHENNLPWDAEACSQAAVGGHLEVLQWLTAHGCPWNSNMCLVATEGACASRSPNGRSVLEWVLAKIHPEDKKLWAEKCLDHAVASAKDEIVAMLLLDFYGAVDNEAKVHVHSAHCLRRRCR